MAKRKRKTSVERVQELNNPAKAAHQKGIRKKKKKQRGRKFGMFLVFIQTVLSFMFLGIVLTLNLLPTKFTVVIAGILLFFLILTYATQRRHKKKALPGKLISLFLIVILGLGIYYLGLVNGAFDKIVGGDKKIDNMVVLVLKDDAAETIVDAKDYTFAVQYQLGKSDMMEVEEAIETELGAEIDTERYDDVKGQAKALWDSEVDAMILNEGYMEMVEEDIAGFIAGTKIIYAHQIEKTIANDSASKVDVKNNTFHVYLSGIDVYGSIQKTSRSDVNIIATVNTETRQILLTTTPRDYYVTIPGVSEGQKDKLTHAGIYGVDASIATLENLYEISIPFFARVNFTSIIEIVDALGGIDVYSEYAFTTVEGYKVEKGMNRFDGKEALAFARERKNVPGGDNQRGKNQQAVLVAMFKKVISPQMLVNAGNVIESVSDNMETNMSEQQIQELIKNQLRDGGAWNIYSVAAEGTASMNYTYSMPGTKLYVTEPDEFSIEHIKELMEKVRNGEMLEGSEIAQ